MYVPLNIRFGKSLNFISVVYWFSSIIDYDKTLTIYTMNTFLL